MTPPTCPHCRKPMRRYDSMRMVFGSIDRYRCESEHCDDCGGRCTQRDTAPADDAA